ncbi:Maf family protein [Litoribrevibacter albus]|uniref:7-methyl-GTP pyrophosphatase n=1 Tax=Litoribrevibacter albus TaxID=1473156 RepID=A0AA37W7Q9_9GAMM|nr:nucleoside triphosphate pyrophosphatase [Litoribrevibacter albus]GLQ31678.1 Maf-like protein YceF [Litoribrevibacter albus]
MPTTPVILASSSPFRRQLLDKFQIDYQCISPDIDESPKASESPNELSLRLSIEKAKAVAKNLDTGLIIASDQVAEVDGLALGKPHTKENAIKQLMSMSGKTVTFHTGLCLLNASTGEYQSLVEPFYVTFRKLTEEQASNYVDKEDVLKCAGSFKSEALGIALFEKLEGEDPNTLIGLPLIKLNRMLENEGVNILA